MDDRGEWWERVKKTVLEAWNIDDEDDDDLFCKFSVGLKMNEFKSELVIH